MTAVKQAASEFLAKKRIAVTGVSRAGTSHGANIVYQYEYFREWAPLEADDRTLDRTA